MIEPLDPIDLLIEGAAVVTVDLFDRVIEDGAIAIRGDRIVSVGSTEELQPLKASTHRVIDAQKMAALPGFVDTHTHAGHALTRALGHNADA
jgi:5-methylthioadenosine/S-adenosylhomocysteine deaminase